MAELLERHGRCLIAAKGNKDYFAALALSIVSQQLSSKAADAIARRLLALVRKLDAPTLANTNAEALRSAGLSGAKARYIHNLSVAIVSGALDLEALPTLDDNEVLARLTAVSGIGRWTAQMFLMFALKRPDILAPGDAGLRRAALDLYGAELEEVSESWRPFRSVASWYLWRHLDG